MGRLEELWRVFCTFLLTAWPQNQNRLTYLHSCSLKNTNIRFLNLLIDCNVLIHCYFWMIFFYLLFTTSISSTAIGQNISSHTKHPVVWRIVPCLWSWSVCRVYSVSTVLQLRLNNLYVISFMVVYTRSVKLSFTEGHINIVVVFKGPVATGRLYKCHHSLS